ncbi:hypothetical protein P153DRAFT_292683 [Dothidotthia symphoricarpi CBS 119687]|uniref:Cytochrome P450 n=1 Tax=Dothidotthia symphoricarpi CBS 119687 TaxID=1392245 RepID=A0A6A6ABC5_9PLEO|nr:uncharacterized protein P153DRAFT_292683 [Dothidotthia symphoricarpi CBS 119687]KAF2128523.1 hypothetical protein P153DRAFT_292683 [Dothidotthia symphoricarpi CBS 119687]
MASLKWLFLGVYASNRVLRMLFLPIWYLLLLSPFLFVVTYYSRLGRQLASLIPQDFSVFDLLPQVVLSVVFVLLPTRLLSGSGEITKSKDGGKRRVQSLPYWIPGAQHLGSIISGAEDWMIGVRESSVTNIIAYKAAGSKHNVTFSTSFLDQVYKNWENLTEAESSRWAVLRNAFRMPKSVEKQYFELQPTIEKTIKREMFEDHKMESFVTASLKLLSGSLPDMITFNSSIVDQMQWERVSTVELTDGTSEAECDFFALINDFCCNTILPPVTGSQFTESYALLASDLASFNALYYALALGLPRFSPVRGLPAAALAKRRLLSNFSNFFSELSSPPVRRVIDDDESVSGEEMDADDDTLLTALNELFKKHELPIVARAAVALQLVHGIVADVVPLVLWTLLHIYSLSGSPEGQKEDATPLERIKKETKDWAEAVQPPSIHPLFPAPPEMSFASTSQAISEESFPYLRSCVSEARRFYGSSASTYRVTKPVTLEEQSIVPGEREEIELDVDSYVDIGLSTGLINTSPVNFVSPDTFRPDRFINTPPSSSIVSPTDMSASYKTALVIAIVAGITQLWEITPAPKKSFFEKLQEAGQEAQAGAAAMSGEEKPTPSETKKDETPGVWEIPKADDGSSMKVPRGEIKVRIRRREDLPKQKVLRRDR